MSYNWRKLCVFRSATPAERKKTSSKRRSVSVDDEEIEEAVNALVAAKSKKSKKKKKAKVT